MAYDDNNPRVRRNPLAGYLNSAVNGVNDTSQPGRNIAVSNYGAVNGVNDPSQSAYRSPPAQPVNPLVTSTYSPAGGATSPPSNANGAYETGQAFRRGAGVVARAVGQGLQYAATDPLRQIAPVAQPLADFTRGFTGAGRDSSLISSAQAAPVNNSDSAAEAELGRTMADLNNPNNPQSPLANRFSNVTAGSRTFNNGTSPIGTQTPSTFADRATAAGGVKQADGSYAFSNIPGQVGYSAKLNDLGNNTNVASGANMANPGIGSSVAGVTPTIDQTSGIRFGNPNDVGFDNSPGTMARNQARSDLLSVLNEDPRSAMGIAARNARMNLADIKLSRGRYGGQSSPYEQVLGALTNSAASPLGVYEHESSNAAKINEANIHNAGGLAEANLRGQYGLAETNARVNAELNKPQYETDANGNLVRVQGTNAQGVMRGGNPLAVTGKINASEEKIYGKALDDARRAGVDDPVAAAKEAVNGYRQLQTRQAQASTPPAEAVSFLKQNPKLKDQFDAKYGKGSADKILNG